MSRESGLTPGLMASILNWLERLLPLVAGLAAGIFLVKLFSSFPNKWIAFIIGAILAGCVITLIVILTNKVKDIFLFAAIFSLPLAYGITPGFQEHLQLEVMANGFPIDLADIALFPLVAGWLYQIWSKNGPISIHFPRKWMVLMIIMLFLNLCSAWFVARDSFFSYSLIYSQTKAYLIAFFIANYVRDEKTFRVVTYAFAALMITQGIIVLEQLFVGVIFTAELLGRQTELRSAAGMGTILRVSGTLGHPNTLAMYLDLLIPWMGFLMLNEKNIRTKVLYAAAIALAGFAVVSSGSRSGWMGLLVGGTISTLLWYRKQGKNPFAGILIIAVICSLTFAALFATSQTFRARLTEEDRGAAEVRIPLMAVAKEMISTNPIQGVGLNNYTREMLAYDRTSDFIASYYNQPVHNTFLFMAAETGLPSVTAFIIFLIIIISEAYQVAQRGSLQTSALGFGLFASLIGWVIHNQSNHSAPLADTTFWILLGLLAAARNDVHRTEARSTTTTA